MPHVLIVCTGNICRSPMAEALLKQRVEEAGLTGWKIASAGTWTVDGAHASAYAVQLMAERGLDLGTHRSRAVNARLIECADLVLVMTQGHAEALRLEFPTSSQRIFLLSEMKDGRRYDIKDPYGGALEDYHVCLSLLEDLIDSGFYRIKSLAEQHERARRGPC